MTDPKCPICRGEGWLCVEHPIQPFDLCEFCNSGEGKACVCNPDLDMPPGTQIIASVDDRKPRPH